jgi:hypothetical protein
VDADGEHEALGIDEQVALAPLDLLAAVVAPQAADAGSLDRLAVDDARTRLRIATQAHAYLFTQDRMEAFPGAVHAPLSKVVEDGLPRRKLVRQQAPGPADPHNVEDRVEDGAQTVLTGPPARCRRGKYGLDPRPFGVREVRKVSSDSGGIHAPQRIQGGRMPDFSDDL